MNNSSLITIHKKFEEQVEKTPNAIAVVFENQKLTYKQLNEKANQLANHLISLGIKPEMLVGICMERTPEMIIGLLGILKAGGAYLPIDLSYPKERLSFMMEDANASIIVTQRSLVSKVIDSESKKIFLDEFDFEKNSFTNPDVKTNPENLAYVIYTSGSTGKPNGVIVPHQNVLRLFKSTESLFGFNNKDVWTFFHSYAFDFSVWEIWGALIYGGKLVIVPYMISRAPESFLKLLITEKVTVLNQTPAAFYQLIEVDTLTSNNEILSLRLVILGGEPLKPLLLKPWFNKHGDSSPQLFNGYGPTETTVFATFKLISMDNISNSSIIGKPIEDIEVYILDEDLKKVTNGIKGELYIGGTGISRGYINRPELNKNRFIRNPFSHLKDDKLYKTGDIVRFLAGNEIEYLGRVDHQVKIHGFRIELGEIENTIRDFKGIKDSVVTVHKYSEEVIRIIAYMVSDITISLDLLKIYLRKFLPEYMIPNLFINIEKIPLTLNGKTDFKALPIPDQVVRNSSETLAKINVDEIENDLLGIWEELLGIKNIGLNDNFFDLGGNSLLMGRLQIRANQFFDASISIVDLFQFSTISTLAKLISDKKGKVKSEVNKSTDKSTRNGTDIAIIGMAGRYPKADNLKIFWQNLVDGVESISFFSDEELEYIPKGNLDSEIKFIKARGVLENVDLFDADFFGFNPREAALMDPQHRNFLECAWEALEDAGYCAEKYDGSIGIFAGSSFNTYLMYNVLKDRESNEVIASGYQITDYMTLTGNDNSFLTTKVAYKLGLKGPAINIQTACSTSLVAIGQAYQSLVSGMCDMALAGGVSITFPQKRGYSFVDGSLGSVDGHCKPFDADATGTVFSSGVGIVILKRLEDALKDGDSIYAVIKSVALNNDGSNKAGYMTPSVEGQSEVILKAQQLAGINPKTIKYIETHGTGTPVGDPIEVASLEKAFRESTNDNQFCGIGSVKSNIGHTDAAAGVTGLIKTALSLYHRLLPPTIHYKKPNPKIDFVKSPFYVVDKLTSLDGMQRPLRAAVSAFGVGGTNAHAILEEFPHISFSCEEDRDKYLFVVSGKTENSLNNNMKALKEYLENNPAEAINDIAYTLHEGRKEFECRQFFVADSITNAVKEIDKVISSNSNRNKVNFNDRPQLVFMFPGQGAQYVNMGKGLYLTEKVFREIVDQSAEFLKPYLELDIRDLLYPKENNDETAKKLEQTVYTQPALFIIEYATAKVLLSYNINPSYMIGHSVGDYVAACLAGVFSLEDALYVIAIRAKLMQKQKPGSMLSVRLNESEIKSYLTEDISLAAINSPNLVVLSGPTEEVKKLSDRLSKLKIENRVLYTSHAYHSKMMEPALKPFVAEFNKIKLNIPTLPFISSLTGTWITNEQSTDPNFWASQLRNAVRFSDGIVELQKKKNLILIELGPGRALTTMASQHRNENLKQVVVTTLTQPNEDSDDKSNLLAAIGKLWVAGLKIEWIYLYKNKKRTRLHLPTYQFDRKSYWIDPPVKSINNSQISIDRESLSNVKNIVKKPKVKKVIQENSMTRKEYIIIIIKDVLEELSGIQKSELEESKSFLELGFDSLFMTQVSLAFQKKFEVKITLRQLLETNPTIFLIAEYIDSKLVAEKFIPPVQEITSEEEGEEIIEEYEDTIPPYSTETNSQLTNNSSAVERLVFEQIEIMKKQLEVLGGKGLKNNYEIQKQTKSVVATTMKLMEPSNGKDIVKSAVTEKKVFERFGPYKPIETKKGGALTEKQQSYLDNLIKEYVGKTPNSKKLTQEHRAHYSDPRTVSGFLRIWKEITYQIITKKSEGSKLIDVDDNEYIDVIMGFGQYLFGHNPKFVRDAIEEQLKLGFEIGPQSPIAGEVAKMICDLTGLERAAFCVTGSEAVLGAIRAARTVTGKDKIVFFAGDYHGIIDEVLIKTTVNGDQVRTMPIAPGIPRENVQNTIALEYGSEESIRIIEKLLPEIGGIMVEPVQARRPDLQPKEFLQKLRKITTDANIPLIFDEVITGFRSAQGGAQEWFGIKADLGTFGKVIGGGFPIGVIAGSKLYMDAFDGGYWQYGDDSIPEAGVTFFAGTFARHPLSLTACYAVLKYLKSKNGDLQKDLNSKTKYLTDELNDFMLQRNVPIKIMNFSSVIYYSYPKDLNYFSLLFFVLRHKGIHILEGFPMFLSEAHSDEDINKVIKAFRETIIELQDGGFFPEPLDENRKQKITNSNQFLSDKRFPLADAQKEIWIASQLSDTASKAFNESATLKLIGVLNINALNDSINIVLKRHSAFRSVFSKDGRYQTVKDYNVYNLKLLDLSIYSEKNKEDKFKHRIESETKLLFNLEEGPLYRFELIKYNEQLHYLIVTAHHIVCDGWSYDVMAQELSIIYTMLVLNEKDELPEPMQMNEYVNYLEKMKSTNEYSVQEKFWLEKLSPPYKTLDLPVDKERTLIRSFSGARISDLIHVDLLKNIKVVGKQNHSTFFSTMISAYAILLNKLTNSEDVITGIPAAGQQVVGTDDLIGHCTNLLPLRFNVNGEKSFVNFLSEVKNIVLDAYENQQVSYGDILAKLKIKREAGRIPLFSTMFNIDPAIMGLKFAELECEMISNPRSGYQFEIGFNLVNSDKECVVECDYNTDLFSESTIIKFIKYYINILEQVTKSPEIKLKEINVLSTQDISDLMNLINN
jgi:amino acid adenylation domain-containing protein